MILYITKVMRFLSHNLCFVHITNVIIIVVIIDTIITIIIVTVNNNIIITMINVTNTIVRSSSITIFSSIII